MFTIDVRLRRVIYVATFETLAIVLSTMLLGMISHGDTSSNLPIAVSVSAIAVVWNFIYNSLFEAAEKRMQLQGRSIKTRVIHSVGFEGGLILFCVPLFMVWYKVGIWEAFKMEAAILVFFLVFTFVFTWIFDKVFTLPNHAAPKREA